MTDLVREIDAYLKRLFPICRSITGNGNRETLKILQEIAPITIHEVPSGTQVYDWIIPDEWNIHDAWIATQDGRRIVDFCDCNLHVVSYSEPIRCNLTRDELQSHLHKHPELPNAIPYRTSYYKRDWGFCVTHAQYFEIERLKGPFEVVVDSTLEPGSLTYGEIVLPGQSTEEILVSTYICHPSMANDNLSGVVMTAFLARELRNVGPLKFACRIVWVPETIGAIAYCARNEVAMKKIRRGFVVSCVGGPGRFGYKESFDPYDAVNAAIEEAFRAASIDDYVVYPFDIHGSDERQYSSQGFRINIASITKDRYYEYPYYHTSLDDLNFISAGNIAQSLSLYIDVITRLGDWDEFPIYHRHDPHCEIMLSKHGLYPDVGGAMLPTSGIQEIDLRLWLLFLCDGVQPLYRIARRLKVPLDDLRREARQLKEKGLLIDNRTKA